MRPAPAESRLRTSEKAVATRCAGSSFRPPLLLTLSKITLWSAPGKVKRKSAAWSVGAISARRPFANVTA